MKSAFTILRLIQIPDIVDFGVIFEARNFLCCVLLLNLQEVVLIKNIRIICAFEKYRRFHSSIRSGVNSFHLIVARRNDVGYQVIDKHKETVRLASGFDEQGNLKREAIGKAVKALERLGERVRKIPSRNLRIVGTNTMRKAKNADVLIEAAERVLGHSVDVIAGAEEARLIFSGVTRGLNLEDRKYFVIDIGGGSTEIIAGYCEKPELLNSLHMGCISVTLNHSHTVCYHANPLMRTYVGGARVRAYFAIL